jgi:hypothetical protein
MKLLNHFSSFFFQKTSKSGRGIKQFILGVILILSLALPTFSNNHFMLPILKLNSTRNYDCSNSKSLHKYYYYIEELQIDLSLSVPYVKSFNIYAVSDAGLEEGWSNVNSYSIPIHSVYLDVQKSVDFSFISGNSVEPKTNLEHPGFTYNKKVGILPSMQYKIEKIKFEYDRQRKVLYNVNSGIIGQTRIRNHKHEIPERPILKISLQSEKSIKYINYIKNLKYRDHTNFASPNNSLVSQTQLHGRDVRVDYEDDPELTQEQYNSLSLNQKFMYKFLHNRTLEFTENPTYSKYEYSWRNYSRKNKVSKYNETIYLEFMDNNDDENIHGLNNIKFDYNDMKNLFAYAHESEEKKTACGVYQNYPYQNWIRLPNDKTYDAHLDSQSINQSTHDLLKGLNIKDVNSSIKIPSEGIFGVPEPTWTNAQMVDVVEVGIYNDEGVLTRFQDRCSTDLKFCEENWDSITWFPFRILAKNSHVVNILKNKGTSFKNMSLNISVDQYGIVLYSKDEIVTDENEKNMLWAKFSDLLFDEDGHSIVFMGKVVGFISFEKIKYILKIGSNRKFNYKGFLKISNELLKLMQKGYGKTEYRKLIDKLFEPKKQKTITKPKDKYNENLLLNLF